MQLRGRAGVDKGISIKITSGRIREESSGANPLTGVMNGTVWGTTPCPHRRCQLEALELFCNSGNSDLPPEMNTCGCNSCCCAIIYCFTILKQEPRVEYKIFRYKNLLYGENQPYLYNKAPHFKERYFHQLLTAS